MLGKIKSIEDVYNYKINPVSPHYGKEGARLGFVQVASVAFGGYSAMDGYRVVTDKHVIHVLIDNGQSCCESWGYFSSDDNLDGYVGATLQEIKLADVALNQQKVEKSDYYEGEGGIQFVDFVTSKGTFQLAVYNAHNGYYGHGILLAKDDEILLNDTL